MNRELAAIDLTHLQFTTLALVAWSNKSGKPITQTEIAREFDIEPMQMSQMMKVLEAKSLVRRRAPKPSSRSRHAEITRKGLSALEKAMPVAIAVQHRMF